MNVIEMFLEHASRNLDDADVAWRLIELVRLYQKNTNIAIELGYAQREESEEWCTALLDAHNRAEQISCDGVAVGIINSDDASN